MNVQPKTPQRRQPPPPQKPRAAIRKSPCRSACRRASSFSCWPMAANQQAADTIAQDLVFALFKWPPALDLEKGTEFGARRILALWAGDEDGTHTASLGFQLEVALSINGDSHTGFTSTVKLAD